MTGPTTDDTKHDGPDHPIVEQVAPMWHKICALLMHKLRVTGVVLTAEDIALMPDGTNIVLHDKGADGLHITLMGPAEVATLMEARRRAYDLKPGG